MHSSRSYQFVVSSLAMLTACFASLTPVRGDVFRFEDGRIISGAVVGKPQTKEIDGKQVKVWVVEVEPGTFIQVHESDLLRNGHEPLSKSETLYAQHLKSAQPKTAEDYCKIAAWCHSQGMLDLETANYKRALDLDPDHATARAAAGYDKDSNGRWVKKEVIMGERRGKVYFGGRWRFPEDVAIEQAEAKADQEIQPIRKQAQVWHSQAQGRSAKNKQAAVAGIQQTQDPRMAGIFAEYLLNYRKPAPVPLRLLYVRVLSRFPVTYSALAEASLRDPEQQVRNACLDALSNGGAGAAVPKYLSYLGDSDNALVNRAAQGLAQFNPEEAVLPLIEALVTTHNVKQGGGPGMNVNSQGGLSFGAKEKVVRTPISNASVLGTLSQITGVNFEYDKARWLAWYASIHAAPARDLRRDP